MPWGFKIRRGIKSRSLWPNKARGVTRFVTARGVKFAHSETSGEQRGAGWCDACARVPTCPTAPVLCVLQMYSGEHMCFRETTSVSL